MNVLNIVDLIPGYRTKVESATTINLEVAEHKAFFDKLVEEALATPAIAEQVEGKEYYFRLNPIELELLIK